MINNWKPLSFPGLEAMSEAREQCHQAIQNVAAVGRSFLANSKVDEFANLTWDAGLQRLVGRWIKGDSVYRSSISIENFEVYLVDEKISTIASIDMNGIAQTDVMVWLEHELTHLGAEFSKLNLSYPYEIPVYGTAKGDVFERKEPKAFAELSKLFHNTNFVLKQLLSKEKNGSEIKCWPHHFDIAATVTLLDTGDPETSRSISLGMSPGDKYYDEPYFYVSPWPYTMKELIDLEKVRGHWHKEDWVGAILPYTKLSEFSLIQDQRKAVVDFYTLSFQYLKTIL